MNSLFENRRFAELMAFSQKDAAQYCVDCGIDTEINGISVYEMIGAKKEVIETKTDEAPIITKEELQALLKSKNIKFSNLLWEAKLLQLAQENNLL